MMNIETNRRKVETEEVDPHRIVADLVIDSRVLDSGMDGFESLGERIPTENAQKKNQNRKFGEVILKGVRSNFHYAMSSAARFLLS